MEPTKKVVLVPWDFTPGCENALLHAMQLAGVANNEILLLHIIPRPWWHAYLKPKHDMQSEIEEIKRKLEEVAEKICSAHNFNPITMVLEGNPSLLLRELVVTANVNLIVSNIIYKFENQIFESSSFLRKITLKTTSVPFIIAEEKPAHTHYIEIVVPLDHDKKYKETLHWIIYLSKYYKCNINLIKPFVVDEGKKKDMANNIYFTKKMLDGNKIIYGIKTAKRTSSFRDEVFKFASNIDADLILIMADKYNNYVDQKSKSSLKIPVMCITPRPRKLQGFN
jgi:hypothetical protein